MRRGQRPPKPDQAATRRHRPGSRSAGAAEGIYRTADVVKEAMRSMAQDALGALSDELATRSSYGEVEAVGERLGLRVRKGMEGALSAPVLSLPMPGAAVAALPGGTGSRGFGPVSLPLNVDARGATREDAGAIGDELEGRMHKVLRDALRGGGQYGSSIAGGVA